MLKSQDMRKTSRNGNQLFWFPDLYSVPAFLASCFKRRTCARFPLGSRLVFVLLALFVIVSDLSGLAITGMLSTSANRFCWRSQDVIVLVAVFLSPMNSLSLLVHKFFVGWMGGNRAHPTNKVRLGSQAIIPTVRQNFTLMMIIQVALYLCPCLNL